MNSRTIYFLLRRTQPLKSQLSTPSNIPSISILLAKQNQFNYLSLPTKNAFSFSSNRNSNKSHHNKKFHPMHKPSQKDKIRDKYSSDYQFYKTLLLDARSQELQRISAVSGSQQQYPHLFKEGNKHRQEWFDYNGVKLKSYFWEPNQSPKAIIVSYHSLNGHSLMISDFAQNLAKKGYLVTAIDYPNFGKSEGDKRGLINSFTSIAEPSQKYFYHIKKQYPNTKIYMMGYSLGGAVAFCLANRFTTKELNGVILLSPALRQNPYHMPFKKRIFAILAITFPNFRLSKYVSRNGSKYKLDEYFKSDPYLYKEGMWTSTAWTMMTMMLTFSKQFKHLETPYLVVQSGIDKLIDPFLAIDLEKVSPSKDKTTVIIHDMWHNVWLDDKKEDVMGIVEQWLEERNP